MAARTLPGSYSEMYPNRFLKADALKGKRVTVTIAAISGETLIGENNKKKDEWIVKIKERPLELVLNKTNAFCLYRMFGPDPHSWIDKRITIYPSVTKFGPNDVDCIRVYGSPDIPEDLEITVPQGRKKAWETVMRKTLGASATTAAPAAPPPPQAPAIQPTERETQIIELLGWSAETSQKWLADHANLSADARTTALENELA